MDLRTSDSRLNIRALPLVLAVVVAACGDGRAPADPEADHCVRAAQRLLKDELKGMGSIAVLESQAWTQDQDRLVRLRFAYPPGHPEGLEYGTIRCTYAFPVEARGDASRRPRAVAIYFRARNLSANELWLLNAALHGTR